MDVLLVDDDEIFLETAAATLESLGATVDCASSALEALGKIRQRHEARRESTRVRRWKRWSSSSGTAVSILASAIRSRTTMRPSVRCPQIVPSPRRCSALPIRLRFRSGPPHSRSEKEISPWMRPSQCAEALRNKTGSIGPLTQMFWRAIVEKNQKMG